MSIELTQEQCHAVKQGEPVHLVLPEIGEAVVLIRAAQFESLKELLDDEKEKKAIREAGLRSAVRSMKDNPY